MNWIDMDWREFLKGRIIVNCKTKQANDDFLKRCWIMGIKIDAFRECNELLWENKYREFTGYIINKNNKFLYNTNIKNTENKKIIEWELL